MEEATYNGGVLIMINISYYFMYPMIFLILYESRGINVKIIREKNKLYENS